MEPKPKGVGGLFDVATPIPLRGANFCFLRRLPENTGKFFRLRTHSDFSCFLGADKRTITCVGISDLFGSWWGSILLALIFY